MKNRPKDEGKSEVLSLVSILSIIVALAAVCLLCLFILNRMGVYDVPWFLSKSKNHDISLTPSDDISNNLFEKNSSKISYISSQASEQTLKNLVISIPERNIYSIRASILYMTTDEEISLTLASARSGDVYKMEITDGSGTVRLAVSCDGKTQTVTEDGETFSSPCGGDGCFYIYSLMPDFSEPSRRQLRNNVHRRGRRYLRNHFRLRLRGHYNGRQNINDIRSDYFRQIL